MGNSAIALAGCQAKQFSRVDYNFISQLLHRTCRRIWMINLFTHHSLSNKKSLKKLLSVLIAILVLTDFSFAQYKAGLADPVNNKAEVDLFKVPVTGVGGKVLKIEYVNTKAVRDFVKSYINAENIHWYIDTSGYFAYYTTDGCTGRTVYNKNGDWVYTLFSYPEEKLSAYIRELVKSVYCGDYKIIWVNEVHNVKKTFYIVHLEDKKTFKNLQICNGEMEVVQEFDKI
jgi:hypothetical protein